MGRTKASVAALAVAVLIIALGVTWYVASPGWTLHQMKAAADSNDPDALNAYVDYPAVREDLKAEIMGQVMAKANRDKAGLGGIGMAIGAAMVGPVIDGLVTPAAVRAALMAKREEARTKAAPKAASALQLPNDPVIVRHGLSEFLLASKREPDGGLVFRRHGLSWKLSGVDLPPEK